MNIMLVHEGLHVSLMPDEMISLALATRCARDREGFPSSIRLSCASRARFQSSPVYPEISTLWQHRIAKIHSPFGSFLLALSSFL